MLIKHCGEQLSGTILDGLAFVAKEGVVCVGGAAHIPEQF